METIAERLKSALESLNEASQKANRAPNSVQLLAVSKTKPVSDIVLAYEAGQRLFGENYVQEGVDKVKALQQLSDIEWHFIGPIQSNKTKLVAEHFDWVHSVDRRKIAKRLSEQRHDSCALKVLIQVNINEEPSKSGVLPNEIDELAEQISELPNLQLRGLMAIPASQQSSHELLDTFAKMQHLWLDLQSKYQNIDTLSMGMSADIEPAVLKGSTMVRVGTAIFGARN
ncbi:YggS family pyridoxal phosphate-dependent enzyme [Aliiglaciecola sp. LCG003]|uniref:YggS family pyridoxal phosphate-dependent enzyme n=1 Tax=Aliiglaciecola sp. LCG003 TaxID=3053655 RepID=UPI002573698F|nr:YggS family pyridoxal phosphate-dependent enzyme [Aliiglaciecola sp. LCG003]WJG08666.1 YggS family pyridoxal phosphate-dependent enzyme [Aliiglaciecola sp. LCG003]